MITADEPSTDAVQGRRSRRGRANVVALALLDIVLIYCAFLLAYWVRYGLQIGPKIQQQISVGQYQPVAAMLLGIMMLALVLKGAYRSRMSKEIVDEFGTIISATTISVATVTVIIALTRNYDYSRGVTVYVWLLVIGLVCLGRAVFRTVQGRLHRKGWGVRRLLVVGASDSGKMIMQSVMNRPDLGYDLAGFVDHAPGSAARDFGRFRSLGSLEEVPGLVQSGAVDEIIVALPASAHQDVWEILTLAERHAVGVKLVPDLFEMSLGRVRIDDIAGIPLLDVEDRSFRRIESGLKRALDVAVALAVGLITLPLSAVLWLAIRLETPGPGIIGQMRVGRGGEPFTCYKFRTMRPDAESLLPALQSMNESVGHMFKMREDPRCTALGRRVRRWSLDELPQLWNVLRGDMSIVGPRPPLPSEVAKYEPRHLRRLEVKPGMTGLWQVSGRSELAFDEMVLMDTYYVENWSIALDVKLMIRTVIAVLKRHGAY